MPPRKRNAQAEEPEYDPQPFYLDGDGDAVDGEEEEKPKRGRGKKAVTAAPTAEAEIEFAPLLTGDQPVRPTRVVIGTNEDGEVMEIQVDDEKRWYVIHCYSGYENKVRHSIEQRIETMGMQDKIFDVVVPTEEEIEVREGKRRTVERRVFPGYILVQMKMDEDSWFVVRNTPGVTGFVGMGNEPTPLRPDEVNQIFRRIEAEAPKVKVTFKPGQKVRIIDGPFYDFTGIVADIDVDRSKVRVMVSFFGRETPVELEFLQVEKA
jgi:transcriptional antiterminator NusG